MAKDSSQSSDAIFCARCATVLHPGSGDFFEIRIEAVADPYPPSIDADADEKHLRRAIERTLAGLSDLTAQEALDQIYRRLVLHLCLKCYRTWVENPAGT